MNLCATVKINKGIAQPVIPVVAKLQSRGTKFVDGFSSLIKPICIMALFKEIRVSYVVMSCFFFSISLANL